MLPFKGPLPCLVLPPNHWINLVVIVLHCLYWELLGFIKKKKKKISNSAYLHPFLNSNIYIYIYIFIYLILTPKKQKIIIIKNK